MSCWGVDKYETGAYYRVHMENIPQMSPLPQSNQMQPQGEKSSAGANLAIVVLIIVIVAVGVKLLMSSSPAAAPAGENITPAETAPQSENMDKDQGASVVETMAGAMVNEKGEAVFSVSSPVGVVVREVSIHNPFKDSWVLIYDGYKFVGAGQAVEIFKTSLAALTYDQVMVRVLTEQTGESNETMKQMNVTVMANSMTNVTIEL